GELEHLDDALVERLRPGRTDHGVAVPMRGHGVEAFEKERGADAFPALALERADRPEKAARGRVPAGKAEDRAFAERDVAADRLMRERDLAFARPAVPERVADPHADRVLFRRERSPHVDAADHAWRRQVIKPHEKIAHAARIGAVCRCPAVRRDEPARARTVALTADARRDL